MKANSAHLLQVYLTTGYVKHQRNKHTIIEVQELGRQLFSRVAWWQQDGVVLIIAPHQTQHLHQPQQEEQASAAYPTLLPLPPTLSQVRPLCPGAPFSLPHSPPQSLSEAGIVQWLERQTRDRKVAGSNPCWSGRRIFFSRVSFLCWLLFRYPFHPSVTTVARKKSRSFCQKCRWQVTAKHAYTLRMWFYWTVLRHWSQLVPNMSNDIWGH